LHDLSCNTLNGAGFSEIITFSFISPESANQLQAGDNSPLRQFVKLMNPLTSEQSVMRTSLLPGLLSIVKENISHGEQNLKLFEWGEVFFRDDSNELPIEKIMIAGVITGNYAAKKWHNEIRQVDFYDIKGAVEVLIESIGLNDITFERRAMAEAYDKNISCNICHGETILGTMGKISKDVLDGFEIKANGLFIFELDVEQILKVKSERFEFRSVGKYPAVFREISIIVDKNVESKNIQDIILKTGGNLTESVDVVSVFEGEKFGPEKKAVSYKISFRSNEGTLDGEQVNRLIEGILAGIKTETGGTLSEG
jgi:phenylalanyl-tRNA synthetase beta chain